MCVIHKPAWSCAVRYGEYNRSDSILFFDGAGPQMHASERNQRIWATNTYMSCLFQDIHENLFNPAIIKKYPWHVFIFCWINKIFYMRTINTNVIPFIFRLNFCFMSKWFTPWHAVPDLSRSSRTSPKMTAMSWSSARSTSRSRRLDGGSLICG